MEIKKIDNEIINEYPKMKDFNKKDLKKNIPIKWSKIGISSFVFGILMKTTKSKAAININEVPIDGGFPITTSGVLKSPIYELLDIGTGFFKFLSIILLIVSIILTIIKKYKNKKEWTTNKKLKILYIITGISIVICIVLSILYNVIDPF